MSIKAKNANEGMIKPLSLKVSERGVSMKVASRALKTPVFAPERLGDLVVRLFSADDCDGGLLIPEREIHRAISFL